MAKLGQDIPDELAVNETRQQRASTLTPLVAGSRSEMQNALHGLVRRHLKADQRLSMI